MNLSSFLSDMLHRLLCFPLECTRPSEKKQKTEACQWVSCVSLAL